MSDTTTFRMGCSFCGKSQDEVKKLVAGPGVYACDACIALCARIVAETPDGQPGQSPAFIDHAHSMKDEQILGLLPALERNLDAVETQMKGFIDVLREREVSWQAIGDALGVSRQAAWKRFS